MKIFKEQYINSIEAMSLSEVSHDKRGKPKEPSWEDITMAEDRIFEIETRNLFLHLGGLYINHKEFKFNLEDYSIPTNRKSFQVDAIALINHYNKYFLLIGECKHSVKGGTGSNAVNGAYDKINTHRSFINQRIKKIFNIEVTPLYVLLTKGHKVSNEKKAKFTSSGNRKKVIFLSEPEQNYIQDCYEVSKNTYFAFNQFLGMFAQDSKFYKDIEVGALKTVTNYKANKSAFTFSIMAKDMMPLSYVAHRRGKDSHSSDSSNSKRDDHYQRILTSGRISSIAKHLERDQSPFINNILVSYRGKNNGFKFIEKKTIGQGRTGELVISGRPGSFHVIDGQHRLFGYSGVTDKKILDQTLIVTAFHQIDQLEEAKTFLSVNRNQKKVDVALMREVQLLLGESAEGKDQVENLATAIVLALREDENSPFNKPAAIPPSESGGALPIEQLRQAMLKGNLLSKQNDFRKGLLNVDDDFRSTAEFASNLLISFFKKIRTATNDFWKMPSKGPSGKNVTLRTNFICGSILVFERMISVGTTGKDYKPEEIIKLVQKYISAYCKNLKNIDGRQVELLFGWRKDGIELKEGASKYPRARYYLLNELLKDFDELYDESDEEYADDEIQNSNEEFDNLIKRFTSEQSSHNLRASVYELMFWKKFHEYLCTLFGDEYFNEVINSAYMRDKVHNPAMKKKDQQLQSKWVDIKTEKKDAVYENDIDWCDWAEIRDLLTILYKDKDSYFQTLLKTSHNVDIKAEIESTFFIQMPDQTNIPQSPEKGLEWINLVSQVSSPIAHPRRQLAQSSTQQQTYLDIEPKIIEVCEEMSNLIESEIKNESDIDSVVSD